jgi:excisionase family DNA binding protein
MVETVYFTPKEVAERLKLRVETVYDYIRKGRLQALRLGNRCRIAQSDLDAFLALQREGGRAVARPADKSDERETGGAERQQEGSSTGGALRAQIERNEAARRLLAEWMADESGYDEQVWPVVERLIEENPVAMRETQRSLTRK